MNNEYYKILWEPIEINSVIIKNRISMSPMGTFAYTQDGTDTEEGLRYFEERAKGGIGLLHTGSAYINTRLAQGSPSIHVDNIHCIPEATVLVERAHRWGAKFFLQLSPGTGRNSKLDLGNPEPPVSASEVPAHFNHNVICRAMTHDEIKSAMQDFKADSTEYRFMRMPVILLTSSCPRCGISAPMNMAGALRTDAALRLRRWTASAVLSGRAIP